MDPLTRFMDSSRPWLLIPIETKDRDLHGKLLLAAFAAKSGYNVIFGDELELTARENYALIFCGL